MAVQYSQSMACDERRTAEHWTTRNHPSSSCSTGRRESSQRGFQDLWEAFGLLSDIFEDSSSRPDSRIEDHEADLHFLP